MQRQSLRGGSSMKQIGILLIVAGVAVYLAKFLTALLLPFVGIAIIAGIVFYAIGALKGEK
jgi:hypothetical protein